MKIGIDIDGVLTDMERWQLDYGSKFFENYHKSIKNFEAYEIREIFDVSDVLDNAFWNTYLLSYVTEEPARMFASEVIQRLKQEGNEIYIITARYLTDKDNEEGKKMRNVVVNWLKQYDIYYDKIIFSPEDKLETCLNNDIDIMIEDKVENIIKISEKIPVICFHAGYNKKCSGHNIYRVHSWYDIYHQIKDNIVP